MGSCVKCNIYEFNRIIIRHYVHTLFINTALTYVLVNLQKASLCNASSKIVANKLGIQHLKALKKCTVRFAQFIKVGFCLILIGNNLNHKQ